MMPDLKLQRVFTQTNAPFLQRARRYVVSVVSKLVFQHCDAQFRTLTSLLYQRKNIGVHA